MDGYNQVSTERRGGFTEIIIVINDQQRVNFRPYSIVQNVIIVLFLIIVVFTHAYTNNLSFYPIAAAAAVFSFLKVVAKSQSNEDVHIYWLSD
jgi:hypothetical protein